MRARVVIAVVIVLMSVLAALAVGRSLRSGHAGGRSADQSEEPRRTARSTPSTVPDVTRLDIQFAVQRKSAVGIAIDTGQISARVGPAAAGTVVYERMDSGPGVRLTVSAGPRPHERSIVIGSTCEFDQASPNPSLCVDGPVMIRVARH
jgi:hypothetical protein